MHALNLPAGAASSSTACDGEARVLHMAISSALASVVATDDELPMRVDTSTFTGTAV
jgi:hypothetical protein